MFIFYFFFIHYYSKAFIFLYYINNRFVSFFQTLYALLSRYKDRSQFIKQIVPTATVHYLYVRVYLLVHRSLEIFNYYHEHVFTACDFCPLEPCNLDHFGTCAYMSITANYVHTYYSVCIYVMYSNPKLSHG